MALTEQPGPPPGGLLLPGSPGFGSATPALPSSEALVRNPALQAQVLMRTGEQYLRTMERGAMLSGEIERNFNRIMETTQRAQAETVRMATEVSTGAHRLPEGSRGTRGGYDPDTAPQPGAGPAAAAPIEPPYPRAPTVAGPDPLSSLTFAQGRNIGQSLRSLEGQAAGRMNQWISERGSRYTPLNEGDVVDVDSGRVAAAAGTSEAQALVNQDPRRFRPAAQGQILDTMHRGSRALLDEGTGEHGGAMRSLARVGMLKTGLDTMAGGAGIKGALGAVSRFAGPIGVAVGAAAGLDRFIGAQREENAFYQQAIGADQAGAFMERGRETLAAWMESPLLGGIGRDRAREQFRAVTDLGLTGDRRGEALGFMSDAFKQWGMDTQASLAVVREATENSTLSFSDLRDRLDEVGETAVRAGGNMADAQANFVRTLDEVQRSISSTGPVATTLASITAGQQAQFAQTPLAGVSDLGAMTSMSNAMMAASQLGVSPTELFTTTDDRLVTQWANVTDQQFLLRLTFTEEEQRVVGDALVERFGSPNAIPTAAAAGEVITEFKPNLMPHIIVQIAQQYGISNINLGNAYMDVAVRLMKQRQTRLPERHRRVTPGRAETGRAAGGGRQAQAPGGGESAVPAYTHGAAPGAGRQASPGTVRWERQRDRLKAELGYADPTGPTPYGMPEGSARVDPPAEVSAYLEWVGQSGKRNVAVESLLKRDTLKELEGKTFQVEGVRGRVGLEDLVTRYGRKVAAGSVDVYRGNQMVDDITAYTEGSVDRRTGEASRSEQRVKVDIVLTADAKRHLDARAREEHLPSEHQRNGTPPPGRRYPTQYPQVSGRNSGNSDAPWGS